LDEAAVGERGLGGEFLVEPVLLSGDPDAEPLALRGFKTVFTLRLGIRG